MAGPSFSLKRVVSFAAVGCVLGACYRAETPSPGPVCDSGLDGYGCNPTGLPSSPGSTTRPTVTSDLGETTADSELKPDATVEIEPDAHEGGPPSSNTEPPPPACEQTAGCAWAEPRAIEGDFGTHSPQVLVGSPGNGSVLLITREVPDASSVIAERRHDGDEWSPALGLSSDSPDRSGYSPCLGVNAVGEAIVAWLEDSSLAVGTTVWASVYNTVTGWATPELVDESTDALGEVRCGIDDHGEALIAWQDYDGHNSHLMLSRLASGQWSTTEAAAGSLVLYELAVSAAGGALLIWQSADNDVERLWGQYYDPATGWTTSESLEQGAEVGISGLDVALVSDGSEGRAVWVESSLGNLAVWSRRYTASGWGPAELISDASAIPGEPVVEMTDDGTTLVVWSGLQLLDEDTEVSNVYLNRYVPGAGWVGAEEIVADAEQPTLALDNTGQAIVAWVTPSDPDLGSTEQYVGVRSYVDGGWTEPVTLTSSSHDRAFRPAVVLNEFGTATVAWADWNAVTGTYVILWSVSNQLAP